MAKILRNAKNYKIVPYRLLGKEAHLTDPYTPPPRILRPPEKSENAEQNPDDITDFPKQQTVPIPEAIPYMEGKYRPASTPLNNGYYPYNQYLQKGKVYYYCSCGLSSSNPWCDHTCNKTTTRNRPIYFNVSENGYYKLCNCKMSSNAPFCNGTGKDILKFHAKTHRGFYEVVGFFTYAASCVYFAMNFYT